MPKEACQTGSMFLEISLSADIDEGQPLPVGFRGNRKQAPGYFHSYDSVILGHCSRVSVPLSLWSCL